MKTRTILYSTAVCAALVSVLCVCGGICQQVSTNTANVPYDAFSRMLGPLPKAVIRQLYLIYSGSTPVASQTAPSFAVVAASSSSISNAQTDPSFGLRSIYVFPNPAVGGKKPTFHIAVGVADSVTIKVFDVAGRPAHQARITAPPMVIDDGSGPQYAYEYVWDGHIPSGVYLYYVQADKSGYGSIRKSGKLAIVR